MLESIKVLGLIMGNYGCLRPPDSGKTRCNWVSPRLHLYFQAVAGKRSPNIETGSAHGGSAKSMQ